MTPAIALLGPGSPHVMQLREWRDEYIGTNPAGEGNFEYLETLRNEVSYQFAFFDDDCLIGGVRFTPVGHGFTLSERLADVSALVGDVPCLLDVNRLVLKPEARGSACATEALKRCFEWVHQHTVHQGLVALCQARYVPLYRRVGARVVTSGIVASAGEQKEYTLINLNFEDKP